MKKNDKEMRKGESTLPKKITENARNTFNATRFLRLAEEMKRIFAEDERNSNIVLERR